MSFVKLTNKDIKIRLLRRVASQLTAATHAMGIEGEPVYITDTNQLKIHNGTEYDAPVIMTAIPTTAGSPGTAGQTAYDADYIYVCVADSTWKRSPLTVW